LSGLAGGILAGSMLSASCSLEFRSISKARRFRDLLMALQLQAPLSDGSHRAGKKGAVSVSGRWACVRAPCSILSSS